MKRLYALYKEIIVPAGLLAAMIIGAGMFALPYAFMRAGFLTGLLYLVIFSGVLACIHILYGRILIHTPEKCRFIGYAKRYLGKPGFITSIITTLFGSVFSLTAYLVLSQKFIELVWMPPVSHYVFLLFWITSTIAIILGIKRLASFEFLVVLAMLFIMAMIFGFGISSEHFASVTLPIFNPLYFFIPYGAVLFSLSGRSGIDSIRDYYSDNKLSEKNFFTALSLGTFLPALFYFLFTLGVVGLSVSGVTMDAVSGLVSLSPQAFVVIGLLGIFSLWTSYVLVGMQIKDILRYDFKISVTLDAIAATCIPLALYLFGFTNFMTLISVSGGVFLALESILVILMWHKIKGGKFHLLYKIIIGIFILGGIYQILMWGCTYFPINRWCGL
ncbi:MAG: aromatic amino acid transport family protein [bacterium]